MNGGHEAFLDAELVVEHLGDGSEAVGGAGSVRNELLACVGVSIYAAYEHGGVVLRGSRHNHVLCTCFDVSLSFFFGKEETGRFYYVFCFYCAPVDFFRVAACGNADVLAIDDEFALFEVIVYGAVEATVHCVVFEHVSHVVHGNQVVDAHHFDVVVRAGCTEHQTADTAETVDTDFNSCHNNLNYLLIKNCVIFLTAQKYILYIIYANKKLNFFTNRGRIRFPARTRPPETSAVFRRTTPRKPTAQPVWPVWPWPRRRRNRSARGCPHAGCRPSSPPTIYGRRGCIQFSRRSPSRSSCRGC